nr:transcriptional regulator [uncultured Dyadobacter sp.]
MKKQLKYETEEEYEAAVVEVERLMDKGEENLTESEFETLEMMAIAAQAYEMEHYYEEPPRTLEGIIELRMYEMKLEGGNLAEMLGIDEDELLAIINGEQAPSVTFLKAIYTKLNIPADFILQHV